MSNDVARNWNAQFIIIVWKICVQGLGAYQIDMDVIMK